MTLKKAEDGYEVAFRCLLEAVSVFEEGDQERGLDHLFTCELPEIAFDMWNIDRKNSKNANFHKDINDLANLYQIVMRMAKRLADECTENMTKEQVKESVERWRTWRKERPEIQDVKDNIANYVIETMEE